jgi:hypothetical protein
VNLVRSTWHVLRRRSRSSPCRRHAGRRRETLSYTTPSRDVAIPVWMCADSAFKLCIAFTKLINSTLHPRRPMSCVSVRFVTVYKFACEVVSLLPP